MREIFNGELEQSSSPTIKVLLLDSSGAPVTGLVFGDVTFRYMRSADSVLNTFPLTASNFIEVGLGIYRVVLDSALLALAGSIDVLLSGAGFDDTLIRFNVRAGNPGNVQKTITVETAASLALSDVQIDIWDSGQTNLLWSGMTDNNGQVVVALNPGSYKVLMRKSRTSFTVPETMSVIGPGAEVKTFNGVEISIPASADPDKCVIYGYIHDITGAPDDQVSPEYISVTAQKAAGVVHAGGVFYTSDKETVKSSDKGLFEIELTRGIKVNLRITRVGVDKTFTVPNVPTVDLSTIV